MNERVMEIVVYIVDSMDSKADENLIKHVISLSEYLIEEGYTETEIDSAFSWLMNNLPVDGESKLDLDQLSSQPTTQNWSNISNKKLSSQSLDFLVQLSELDLIGDDEIEQILDQSIKKGKIGTSISEIIALVDSSIFHPDNVYDGSFFVFKQNYQAH